MEPSAPPGAHVIAGIEDLVPIGHGGAAVVYRGRQPELDRDVAVKVVWSRGTAEADLARWRREVTAMARLSNHPNIVAVYDGGLTADGLPYLVMPFVPGGTLGDRLRAQGPIPAAEVVAIGVKLAGALAAAHASGVLHRDLKPDNVLLSPYGEPQLSDFGIARLLDSTATKTTNVHATVGYAAPEVLAGKPASEASDVYGLAATLHACLAGTAPHVAKDGEPLVAMAVRVMSEPAPDLRAAGVPDAVAAVVEHAMAKDPAARIPTADELARRLTDALGPAVARERPAPEVTAVFAPAPPADLAPAAAVARPPRPTRRRPIGAVLAAVALAVLGAVAAVALLGDDGGSEDVGGGTTAAEQATTTAPAATVAPPSAPTGVAAAAVAYFDAIAAGDLDRSYAMTSPGFQAAQPFEGYVDFWSSLGRVSIEGEPEVDDEALTATVQLRYRGRGEAYPLSFVRGEDGSLLVDGPRPR